MKVLHFDCISGISGDMTIGAFLDAGMDFNHLAAQIAKLGIDGYSLKRERVVKKGLSATKFNVMDADGNVFGHAPMFAHCRKHEHGEHGAPHEHARGYDHGHGHGHVHDHDHDHEHVHRPDDHIHPHPSHHDHHEGHAHPRPPFHDERDHRDGHGHDNGHEHSREGENHHRGLREIRDMINVSGISARAKKIAVAIFEDIAAAESKMHDVAPEKIHFHEVGALDSIIDIVGTAVCVDYFGIEECTVSSLPVSFGYLNFSHGKWPNPAPAALELLKGFELRHMDVGSELITPTGAAILRVLCGKSSPLPSMKLSGIGYGAGFHEHEHPNVLRVMIGETAEKKVSAPDNSLAAVAAEIGCACDTIDVITSNIDDMPPEHFEMLVERLMSEGALDAAVMPVLMKKGRPSYQLSVICGRVKTPLIAGILFRMSTTIGMRVESCDRLILDRKTVALPTAWGDISFKVTYLSGRKLHEKPEYEDLKKYAAARGISAAAADEELRKLFADGKL